MKAQSVLVQKSDKSSILPIRVGVPFQSGDPLLHLKGDIHQRLQVIEAERGAVTPRTGLIFERPGEGPC